MLLNVWVKYIYAKDTKTYCSVSDENFHEIIQESINAMVEWGDKLLGFPNRDNCKVLFLENSTCNHPYKMSNDSPLKTLEITKCEKD